MAPPPFYSEADFYAVHLPEDVPVDFLEGRMDLKVVLPSNRMVRMSVERRTPMMDLLVQVTTENRLSPGDHVIQVMNERSEDFLYYKPSTPIGALDTAKIHIVPKHLINEAVMKKAPMKVLNQPFEATFRLQVRLPRNQLYVVRVSSKTTIQQILMQVCAEKGFDSHKYEVRKTDNSDEKLRPSCTLADYGVTEVAIVPGNKSTSRSVSTSDILRLQELENNIKRNYRAKTRSSAGDSSVSSESGGGCGGADRSLSPVNMSTISASTSALPSVPGRTKKRRAPAPPPVAGSRSTTTLGYQSTRSNPALATLEREPSQERRRRSRDMSPLTPPAGILPASKSASLSSLHFQGQYGPPGASNLSTISTGSVSSINSVGKKRRAPVPPTKQSTAVQLSAAIPEETPSLMHTEDQVQDLRRADRQAHHEIVPEPAPRTSKKSIQDHLDKTDHEDINNKSNKKKSSKSGSRKHKHRSMKEPLEILPGSKAKHSQDPVMDNKSANNNNKEEEQAAVPTNKEIYLELNNQSKDQEEEEVPTEPPPPPPPQEIKAEEDDNAKVDNINEMSNIITATPVQPLKGKTIFRSVSPDSALASSESPGSTRRSKSPKESTKDPNSSTSSGEGTTLTKSTPQKSHDSKSKLRRPLSAPANKLLPTISTDTDNTNEGVVLRRPPNKPPRTFTSSYVDGMDPVSPMTNDNTMKNSFSDDSICRPKEEDDVQKDSRHARAVQQPIVVQKNQPGTDAINVQNAETSAHRLAGNRLLEEKGPTKKLPTEEKPTTILNPRAKTQKSPPNKKLEDTTTKTTTDNLPNFRMAAMDTANVPGTRKSSLPSSSIMVVGKDGHGYSTNERHKLERARSVQDDDYEDEEELVDDLNLFSDDYVPPPKPAQRTTSITTTRKSQPQKKKSSKVEKKKQTPPPGKLTEEEERLLEEAQKATAEQERLEEEEKQEKWRQLRLKREMEEAKEKEKLAKTHDFKVERDLKARATKEPTTVKQTEDLRAQLKNMMEGGQHTERKVVDDLQIDEDDDLLPIRRNSNTTSSDDESTDMVAEKSEKERDTSEFFGGRLSVSEEEEAITELKSPLNFSTAITNYHENDDAKMENCAAPIMQKTGGENHEPPSLSLEESNTATNRCRREISDALEESFATIDFGPEDDDSLKSDVDEKSSNLVGKSNEEETLFDDLVGKIPDSKSSEEVGVITTLEEVQKTNNEDVIKSESSLSESYSLPDEFSKCLPDPPSGFKDYESAAKNLEEEADEMLAENSGGSIPVIAGPMQFSINSYTERTVKEAPYKAKLGRSESLRDEQAPKKLSVFPDFQEQKSQTLSKAESFNFARKPVDLTASAQPAIIIDTGPSKRLSKPVLPPKPESPEVPAPVFPKRDNLIEDGETPEKPKLERSKTFAAPLVARKTSFQSHKILPNDDLILNRARRQKSFAGPAAVRIAAIKYPERKKDAIVRASSLGNLDQENENENTEESPVNNPSNRSSIKETFEAIKKEILASSNNKNSDEENTRRSVTGENNPWSKISRPEAEIVIEEKPSNDQDMSSLAHHQRMYHYGGPPSISMGTWNDRPPPRSQFAPPPPAAFATPPAGVPGGRMAAGYHSLQFQPFVNNAKYSRDGSDHLQLHKSQVQAFAKTVEQTAKKQLGGHQKPDRSAGIKPWISSSKSVDSGITTNKSDMSNNNKDKEVLADPKAAILAASRKPSASADHEEVVVVPKDKKNSSSSISGSSSAPSIPSVPAKPQFYFGQAPNGVKESVNSTKQTAIDKVKRNEALTHPKPASREDPVVSVSELSRHGKHMSVITVTDSPPKKASSPTLSSTVSSLSSPTSSSSSSNRSSPSKEDLFKVPRPKTYERSSSSPSQRPPMVVPPTLPRPFQSTGHNSQPTQDEIRKAFEAELMAGKGRLKKSSNSFSLETRHNHDVGKPARPPPAPVPPPPPPSNGHIPVAPKLSHGNTPKLTKMGSLLSNKQNKPIQTPSRKMVAPNGLSAREELMLAIRGKGGVQGLKKTNHSTKNL